METNITKKFHLRGNLLNCPEILLIEFSWENASHYSKNTLTMTQVKWCGQVFGTIEMLPSIYVDVLVTLQKDITSSIDVALKQQPQPISFLIQLKEVTDRFAHNMRSQLEILGQYLQLAVFPFYMLIISS